MRAVGAVECRDDTPALKPSRPSYSEMHCAGIGLRSRIWQVVLAKQSRQIPGAEASLRVRYPG